ncbi:kinase-like domain-containing protein [Annulohypoxylon bovei var. microspora]|nr:kinase-like domain-containing protein [Annulohypoxylon bovei var. microspora]
MFNLSKSVGWSATSGIFSEPDKSDVQKWGDRGFVLPHSKHFADPGRGLSGEPLLPTPEQVRAGGRDPADPDTCSVTRPPPVEMPSLALLVKYGSQVSAAEAERLVLVRKHLPAVPVPEVYGWCEDGEQTFAYTELVEGRALEGSWDRLTEDERVSIRLELRGTADAWRGLPQKLFSDVPFTGHVGKRPLPDWISVNSCAPTAGPFEGVSRFHDWFTSSFGPRQNEDEDEPVLSRPPRPPHPYRSQLPDDVPIAFTHADLHPSNILISRQPSDATRVASVVDWQQAGWRPAYWEHRRSRRSWSEALRDTWAEKYLPTVLEPCICYDYRDYLISAYGM